MRKTEFRGKRVRGSGWAYGYYYRSGKESIIIERSRCWRVDPKTVGQFTELTDKNGVKIFEGDLLHDSVPVDNRDSHIGYFHSLLPVVWCGKTAQWCVDNSFENDGSHLVGIVEYFGDNLEVKGNTHDQ